jgi:hypothetical protein
MEHPSVAGYLAGTHPVKVNLLALMKYWPERRAMFCRGLDPERFLAEIHGYGWSPEMLEALEVEVRRRMAAEPGVPVIEHMLDAAIKVRHGGDHDLPEL